MNPIRIAVLISALLAPCAAFSQITDFSLEILDGGVALPGGDVVYAFVVTANWWTDAREPFTVRLAVPPGLEPATRCTGEMDYDAASRVLTWADRLDNSLIALKSCPLNFRVDPSLAPGTTFTLEATLATPAPDQNPGNNTASITGTVWPWSELEVVSSVDVRTYRPGANVTYTFTVTNHGPQDAQHFAIENEVSPHVSIVSFEQTSGPSASFIGGGRATIPTLRAGASATFRLVARANPDVEAANNRNRVVVRSNSVDVNERNNEFELWTFAGPDADLKLSASRAGDMTAQTIPVTVRVTNDGPDTVRNVLLSNAIAGIDGQYDVVENVKFVSITPSQGQCSAPVLAEIFQTPPLPPHWSLECALGALPSGASATIAVVIERMPKSPTFRLSSVISPAQNDRRPANNGAHLVFEPSAPRRRTLRK